MGTEFRLIVESIDAVQAQAALDAAAQRLEALNASLSDYIATSELVRLSSAAGRGHWHLLQDDLWKVLSWGNELARQSQGAFDMTVGPLTRLWRVSRRRGKLPSPVRLTAAMDATGYRFLELDEARQRGRLLRPHMRLDLGGIAKGYAVDEALMTLRAHGILTALVDGGGDLRVMGRPRQHNGWRIEIDDLAGHQTKTPRHLTIENGAVATSGDLYQSIRLGEREFSHIIDPKTGLGLEFRRSVTVVAPTAMTADALASAISVLPVDASRALLTRHYPGCAAQILTHGAETGRLDKATLGEGPFAETLRHLYVE